MKKIVKKLAAKAKKKAAAPKKPAVVKKEPKDKPAPKAAKPAKRADELHKFILKALDQEKGEDIVSLDLAGKSSVADYLIVVTGSSSRQIVSMAKKIRDKIQTQGYNARIEGAGSGDWVIIDAVDVVVHFFRAEVRQFYNLEKLWGTDFSTVDYTLYKS
jgi:ribosome-associated protein